MIFYSGSRYQEYLEIMEGEIQKLERGDLGRLRSVYGVFATQDDQLIKRAGEAVRQQLSPMTDLQLLGPEVWVLHFIGMVNQLGGGVHGTDTKGAFQGSLQVCTDSGFFSSQRLLPGKMRTCHGRLSGNAVLDFSQNE